MAERHALADRQQPVRRRVERADGAIPSRSAARQQQQRIADRLGRREQQQTPRVLRQRARVGARSSPRSVPGAPAPPSIPKPPASCVAVNPRGSSSNASGLPRVSATIRSRTRSSSMNRTAEPSSARASPLRRPVHLELGQVLQLLARLARGEHDPDRLGQQAPGHERQRQRRRLIQPLSVVDDAQQRALLGHLREQAQHRQPDEEPIRGGARAQPEHDLQRLALRSRELRRADRASARTADADRRTPAPSRTRRRPPARPSRRTPTRPGTPAAPSSRSQPRPAAPATGSRRWRIVVDQAVQQGALGGPPEQARCRPVGGRRFSIAPTPARLPRAPGAAGHREGPGAR